MCAAGRSTCFARSLRPTAPGEALPFAAQHQVVEWLRDPDRANQGQVALQPVRERGALTRGGVAFTCFLAPGDPRRIKLLDLSTH